MSDNPFSAIALTVSPKNPEGRYYRIREFTGADGSPASETVDETDLVHRLRHAASSVLSAVIADRDRYARLYDAERQRADELQRELMVRDLAQSRHATPQPPNV